MKKQKIVPFLTFTGKAEEAMEFYVTSLPNTKITTLVRYGKNHPYANEDEENLVLQGALSFFDQEIRFMDMSAAYPAPPFTWASSLYINCSEEAEFDSIFASLSNGGEVMMGPEAVGNIRKCAWVNDKYGVTWQLVWE